MRKKARLKKKHLFKKLKIVLFIIVSFTVLIYINDYLNNIKLYSSNEEFIMELLNDSNHHLKYEKQDTIAHKLVNFLSHIDIKKPVTLLKNNLNYENNSELVFEDNYDPDTLNSFYIADPNPIDISKPLVYIYNSHQLENYSSKNYEAYNITPNVMMASYLLREKLNKLGIGTIVEEADITEFIRINNWNYNYSYVASRYYILDAIEKNPSLEFFIDLHRDSVGRNASVVSFDNKNYAKVLFVVGLEHENYQKNLDLANALNNKIVSKYPSLSRGVLTKSGPNVDGIYNQDVNPNMILLELGGNENTIDEVLNTIEVISQVIKEYFDEKK